MTELHTGVETLIEKLKALNYCRKSLADGDRTGEIRSFPVKFDTLELSEQERDLLLKAIATQSTR